jgi:hypothetical protein
MVSMNSIIRDERRILHFLLTVNENLTAYPIVVSQSFMTLFDVIRENPFPRKIAGSFIAFYHSGRIPQSYIGCNDQEVVKRKVLDRLPLTSN